MSSSESHSFSSSSTVFLAACHERRPGAVPGPLEVVGRPGDTGGTGPIGEGDGERFVSESLLRPVVETARLLLGV